MKNIEELLNSDFQIELFKATIQNLNDKTNKLQLNNYAYSMRELSRHFLKSLAPDIDVIACSWYRNETEKKDEISRGERIKYAIQGGLDNNFVNNEIIEIEYLNKLKKKYINLKVVDSPYNKTDHFGKKLAITLGIKAANNNHLLLVLRQLQPDVMLQRQFYRLELS